MATLSKETIQRLAVLRALSMWRRGAYGPLRLHKTLYFADEKNEPEWYLFTFKKWRLGQYSDEIAETLNALRGAGRITSAYDGPSERIKAALPTRAQRRLNLFFGEYFPEWNSGLGSAFKTWAYLTNDGIVDKAHKDRSYTQSEHGQIILKSFQSRLVHFSGLSEKLAESLNDMVDNRLQQNLRKRLAIAAKKPVVSEDWRHIYFGAQRKPTESA